MLRKPIRKAKKCTAVNCYLHLQINLKRPGNIVNNEIGTASGKKFTQTEFKLGNKIIGTNQSAKIFNNYFINGVDKLITQQPNTESAIFMFVPCINSIKAPLLFHSDAHNHKITGILEQL
jgi:hypothetical protein